MDGFGGWGIPSQLTISDLLKIARTGLGTTSTDGIILENSALAAAGAQQISPRTRWTGWGWETNTGSSQQVDYIAQLMPVQGAAAPQARLDFNYAINGGALQATPTMSLLNGNLGIGTTGPVGKLSVTGASSAFNDVGIFQITTGTGASADNKLTFGVVDGVANVGYSWIQAVKPGDNLRNLALNPNGGSVGIGTTSFGTDAAKVLSFGGPATPPTTRPADAFTVYPFDVNGAGTMGLAWMSEDNGIGILGLQSGFGTTTPETTLEVSGSFKSGTVAWPTSVLGINPGRGLFSATGGAAVVALHDNTAVAADTGPEGLYFIGRSNDTGPAFGTFAIIKGLKENATQGNVSGYLSFRTTLSPSNPAERMRITGSGNIIIGTTTSTTSATRLAISDSTQLAARIGLTGQEYYQASNTSTDGLALVLGVNRASNRQLWIGDTAALAQNATNTVMRFTVGGTGVPTIDAVATDGTTTKVFVLGNASGIQYGKALVALGGGAAPTLGTIGGSGPTVAAQNAWIQIQDSTGANVWIAVWK